MLFPLRRWFDAILARAGLRALRRLDPLELDYLGIDDVFDDDGLLIRLEEGDE